MQKVENSELSHMMRALAQEGYELPEEFSESMAVFFGIVESGKYSLSGEQKIRIIQDKITAAASAIIDSPVKRVVTVSADGPFTQPSWMPDDVFDQLRAKAIKDSLHEFLLERLRAEFSFTREQGVEMESTEERALALERERSLDEIARNFLNRYLGGITSMISREMEEKRAPTDVVQAVGSNFFTSLLIYFRLNLDGRFEEAEKLRKLLVILPTCIPLGFVKGEDPALMVYKL